MGGAHRLGAIYLGSGGDHDEAEISKGRPGGARDYPEVSKRRAGRDGVQDQGLMLRPGGDGDRGRVSMGTPMGDVILPMGDVFEAWAGWGEARGDNGDGPEALGVLEGILF